MNPVYIHLLHMRDIEPEGCGLQSPLPHRGRGLGEGALIHDGMWFPAPSPSLSPGGGEGYRGSPPPCLHAGDATLMTMYREE
jgi:hypothetical protein